MENRPSGPVRIPEGMWVKCQACKEIIFFKEVERRNKVCPKCSYHFRLSAAERLCLLADGGKYTLFSEKTTSSDPLKFKDKKKYRDRIKESMIKAGDQDAVLVATATLEGMPVVIASMEFAFMGGSMGSVVGEKITRAAEKALSDNAPLIIVSCSGGARMQEGPLSLMQMAKISAAIGRLKTGKIPFISVLADPTTGGVTASYAMQGDVIISEPGALIGFAGPRVIEQTIRQKLPEGFQRAEFLLEHGIIDMVVPRDQLKGSIASLLSILHGR
ncbi:MAG TPA: acetyl-CoA carboxylase, carboxyltransferase subunit beta [Thermoanaerobaculia bacterium]|nr:acetyl-CoA carboxylase, carboxyltransferase subunit beta [Thermoanaerobaculia bacterium]HUM29735.1 acetyl-CoA carboxylase, carboxyltransferase subunit beta [Thermoanaerobaculia bacterium]HXK67035.1 acetyl-CoA carboxylase, carboxyltransferase subunit beta [Thermoanaerobaculia bacterium]